MTTYHVQVHTYGDPIDSWSGNAVKHETAADAIEAAKDLFFRWTAVEFWRVVDSNNKLIKGGP